MRHRIGGGMTGLGNPAKELLDCMGKLTPLVKKMAREATRLYFKKWGGCDYEVRDDYVKLGIEPAYRFEDLRIILIRKNIGDSYLRTGRAFGYYGGGIRSTYRFYSDYKRNGKFKKFVDRWHGRLFK